MGHFVVLSEARFKAAQVTLADNLPLTVSLSDIQLMAD